MGSGKLSPFPWNHSNRWEWPGARSWPQRPQAAAGWFWPVVGSQAVQHGCYLGQWKERNRIATTMRLQIIKWKSCLLGESALGCNRGCCPRWAGLARDRRPRGVSSAQITQRVFIWAAHAGDP